MTKHPAKYNDKLLPIFKRELDGYYKVLDPFAGSGKLRTIRPDAFLLEIEPEWAEINNAEVGDFLEYPFEENFFDAVCTSPTYANRMADHHNAQDGSRRNTYRHTLNRELHPNNSGKLQWGYAYRNFHCRAWQKVWKILKPGGIFVLNIKDHVRNGRIVPVSRFHKLLLLLMGYKLERTYEVFLSGLRYGENHQARVEYENIFIFRKPKGD